jgi:DNA-nicking Smr family endonuclease
MKSPGKTRNNMHLHAFILINPEKCIVIPTKVRYIDFPMSKPISEKDMEIFRQTVDNIRIHKDSTFSQPTSIEPHEMTPPDIVYGEDYLEFFRSGVQRKKLQQLKKAHINQNATLDLHGMTQEEAQQAIIRFVEKQLAAQQQTLLIIHGKGKNSATTQPATLKNLTNHLLRQLDPVLAFCSAQPYDGGTGALYVLLRSARNSNA